MCEYQIPFHVQEEIMKRLPVKSLIQFRSVSKAWKSLIDSPRFTAAHSLTQPPHLLVSYEDPQGDENYVCFIDDETFPQQRSILNLPPLSAEQIEDTKIVGSSHGLVCLRARDPSFKTEMTLVWNPSIRKYVAVVVPTNTILCFAGFGVCPVTNDPKIISITQSSPEASYEVMVYTLSSGTWRSLSTTNLPIKRIRDPFHPVVTDGFIYWHAETLTRNCIMSFDVTDETFQVIDVPDALARKDLKSFHICKLRESLAILQSHGNTTCTVVWMMEDGVQRSFAKLFTIAAPRHSIVGYRKSGVPILEESGDDDDDDGVKLVLYEPNSENIDVLAISTPFACFSAHAYTETLLLLGRSDCISY